jgi:hypothetical protein
MSIIIVTFFPLPSFQEIEGSRGRKTLKGSLSVLKLIPRTYFNQTGNPLYQRENDSQIKHSDKPFLFKKKKLKHEAFTMP